MKTLDSLAALASDVRDGVRRLGRAGGALLVGLALALGAGGVALLALAAARQARGLDWHVWDLRLLAALLAGLALALAIAGVRQALWPRPPSDGARPPLAVDDLLQIARASLRPFYVCLRCRQLWSRTESIGRCPQCDSAAECLEVRSDADLQMVEAALR